MLIMVLLLVFALDLRLMGSRTEKDAPELSRGVLELYNSSFVHPEGLKLKRARLEAEPVGPGRGPGEPRGAGGGVVST